MRKEEGHDVVATAVARLVAGEAAPEAWRDAVLHLLTGCERCRDVVRGAMWPSSSAEMRRRRGNVVPVGPSPEAYEGAFAAALRATEIVLKRRHAPAARLLAQLDSLPREAQEIRVRNQRRYASPALVEALVERSHQQRYSDPEAMLHWARLAVAAALAAGTADAGSLSLLDDCRARALAQLATARRVRSDFAEAASLFARALRHFEEGNRDPELRAWLWLRRAALHRARREFGAAIGLAVEAAAIYRRLHDRAGEAAALISVSAVRIEAEEPGPAVPELIRCLDLLYPSEIDLTLCASHNLIICYIDLDRPHDAYNLIAGAEPQIEECPDEIARLRWKWQQGKVDRELGFFDAAEARLTRARDGLEKHGLTAEVALLSLDLAEVFVRRGRIGEVMATIGDAVTLFRALGVQRDLLAALLKAREVAESQEAAIRLMRHAARMTRQGILTDPT